jgi:hypothetical protein
MTLDRVAVDLEVEPVMAAVFWMSEVRGETALVVLGEEEEDVGLESVVTLMIVSEELTTTSGEWKDEGPKDEVKGRGAGVVEFSPDAETACPVAQSIGGRITECHAIDVQEPCVAARCASWNLSVSRVSK